MCHLLTVQKAGFSISCGRNDHIQHLQELCLVLFSPNPATSDRKLQLEQRGSCMGAHGREKQREQAVSRCGERVWGEGSKDNGGDNETRE